VSGTGLGWRRQTTSTVNPANASKITASAQNMSEG
jgi:hypothetical protein